MKNYLTLVLALSVVSAPAFASRARLESLGEGQNGSYYIDDARNIFLNPAQIVHYKKKLWLETGTDTPGTPDIAVTNNRGQGGFSNTFGDFTYGLYMNQTSQKTEQNVAVANATFGAGLGGAAFQAPDSTIEAFFAGEGAMNWGISAWWAGNDQTTGGVEGTAKQIGVRVGIETAGLQVFATVGIVGDSQLYNANQSELKAKVGVNGGVTYKMNDATYFGKVLVEGADVTNVTTNSSTDGQIRDTSYGVGAGWKHEMTKATNMFARVEADYEKLAISGVAQNTWNVPVAVGAEAQALSWLAIRGSVQESVLGEQWGARGRTSLGGTTTVSLGAGLTFGDVQIDGLIATTGASNPNNSATAGNTVGFGTAPQTDSGFGFGNNMLTRVSLTYNF